LGSGSSSLSAGGRGRRTHSGSVLSHHNPPARTLIPTLQRELSSESIFIEEEEVEKTMKKKQDGHGPGRRTDGHGRRRRRMDEEKERNVDEEEEMSVKRCERREI
jgi:hypothetical protein